jgi:hypothetical protein
VNARAFAFSSNQDGQVVSLFHWFFKEKSYDPPA